MTLYYTSCINTQKSTSNVAVEVYKINRSGTFKGQFSLVGRETASSASYKGIGAVVAEITAKAYGFKLSDDGYGLARKDIRFIELPRIEKC